MPKSKPPLLQLIAQTRQLFHRLKQAGDELHSSAGINASMRGVMETLYTDGAQTVPQIAHAKSVSRQHIQLIINQLLKKNLIQQSTNPLHKRSPCFALNENGRELFTQIAEREVNILKLAQHQVSDIEIIQAVRVLQKLNVYFHSDEWTKLLSNQGEQT